MFVTSYLVNAFTENGQGGNPAAVVLDRPDLTAEQRQLIAQTVGVSETVFLDSKPSRNAMFTAEFYTPNRKIENCGHATVAAFSLIQEFTNQSFGGFDMAFSDPKKPVQEIHTENDRIFLELPTRGFATNTNTLFPEQAAEVMQALGLTARDLDSGADLQIRSLGNPFVLVPVKSAAVLQNITPDLAQLTEVSRRFNVIGVYPFTRETAVCGRDASARMFAPRYGIAEEAATGMAAASLAHHLYQDRGLRQSRILIEQGQYMQEPAPSLIEARLETSMFGKLRAIQVGGRATQKAELKLEI